MKTTAKSLGLVTALTCTVLLAGKASALTVVPVAPLPTGTVIDSISIPFDYSGTANIPKTGSYPYHFAGSLDQQVVRQSDGTLAFVYQFNLTAHTAQTNSVDAGTVYVINPLGFAAATNAQLFAAPGSGALYPTQATYDPNDYGGTRLPGFNSAFPNIAEIPFNSADLTTRPFFITTSATDYDTNGQVELWLSAGNTGSSLQTFTTFAPDAASVVVDAPPPVPEPATASLLALATVGLLARFRRK